MLQIAAALQKLPNEGIRFLADSVGQHQNDVIGVEHHVPHRGFALRLQTQWERGGTDAGNLSAVADQGGGGTRFHHGHFAGIEIKAGNIEGGKGFLRGLGEKQSVHHADCCRPANAAADKLAEQFCCHAGFDRSIFAGAHAVGQHQIGIAGVVGEQQCRVAGDRFLTGVEGGSEMFQPVLRSLAEPIANCVTGEDRIQFFQCQIQRFRQNVFDRRQAAVQLPSLTAHFDHQPVGLGVVYGGGVTGVAVVQQLPADSVAQFAAVADMQMVTGRMQQVFCGCQLFQKYRAAFCCPCRQKPCLPAVGGVAGKQCPQSFLPAAMCQFLRNRRQVCSEVRFHFPEAGEGFLVCRFPAPQLVGAAAADGFADFTGGISGGFFLRQNGCNGIGIFPHTANGICHVLQTGGQGQRVVGTVGQVCDQPLVQPAAVQKQKGSTAQKQVDDSGDLEQAGAECNQCHKREQEEYAGDQETVFFCQIPYQQTAHRQDQQGHAGFRRAEDRTAGRECTADHTAGTAEFLCPDQRNCDADDAAGVHGGNSIAAECCHRQNQNHRRGTAVCGTQRDLSGRTDAGKDSVHKVGGTAGEGGSHGVADHLRTAGVEQQGNDNAREKDTQSSAACDAGGSFGRAFHHPQADDHHQCKQQGQIVQHGVGDEVGD